jgi:hypothetical protein
MEEKAAIESGESLGMRWKLFHGRQLIYSRYSPHMYTQLNIELCYRVSRVRHENCDHVGEGGCLNLRCVVLKNKMPSTLEYAEAARHIISREKTQCFSAAIIISLSQSKLTIIKRCGTNLNIEQLIHILQHGNTGHYLNQGSHSCRAQEKISPLPRKRCLDSVKNGF